MNRISLPALALLALAIVTWRFWPVERESASGGSIVDVIVPELTARESEGRGAFDTHCATCHGENAGGREGMGPPLVHVIYEPGHHGDAAFALAANAGVRQHHWRFGDMPPVGAVSEDEIATIVAYVRALQRANGIR